MWVCLLLVFRVVMFAPALVVRPQVVKAPETAVPSADFFYSSTHLAA